MAMITLPPEIMSALTGEKAPPPTLADAQPAKKRKKRAAAETLYPQQGANAA